MRKYIILLSLITLTACGYLRGDREPEPEIWTNSDDFYASLWEEINYTPQQQKLITYGRSLLGTHYSTGGNNHEEGFDCSGFTRYIYAQALDMHLPRTAREMAVAGKPVQQADLKAGDLVFFNTSGADNSHVGVYIGNGRFFHASTAKGVIVIGNMRNEYFAKRYNGARRVLS